MARKPLFETLIQQMSRNFTSIVIIAIGAMAFFYLTRRKADGAGRPPAARPLPPANPAGPAARRPASGAPPAVAAPQAAAAGTGQTVLQRIKKKQFVGSKVCVVWEIFYKNGEWADGGKAKDILAWYAFSSDVYVMCKIGSRAEEKGILAVLMGIEGIQRQKVLFCTTQKAHEAFARQIIPALLITNDRADASFLSGVLPFTALVGSGDSAGKPNVACVPSAASLSCDESA